MTSRACRTVDEGFNVVGAPGHVLQVLYPEPVEVHRRLAAAAATGARRKQSAALIESDGGMASLWPRIETRGQYPRVADTLKRQAMRLLDNHDAADALGTPRSDSWEPDA